MRYRLLGMFAGALTALAMTAGLAQASPVPQPMGRDHQVHGSRFCGNRSFKQVDGDQYILRVDGYTPNVFQCLWNKDDGANFRVIRSWYHGRGGDVASFDSIFQGCDPFGVCTKSAVRPLVSKLKAVYITVRTRFPIRAGRKVTDSSDDYFTSGPLNGAACIRAELILRIDWQGTGFATMATVRTGRMLWNLEYWMTGGTGPRHWLILAEPARGPRTRLSHLNEMPIIAWAVRQGLIRPGWRYSQRSWGFERFPGPGDAGNAVTRYAVEVVTRHGQPSR